IEPAQFVLGCFEFEPEFNRCSVVGSDAAAKTDLHLTPTEFRILLSLARAEGIPQSRHDLIKAVWAASGTNIEARGIDTHVAHLRKKLGISAGAVQSVYAKGYVFNLPRAA